VYCIIYNDEKTVVYRTALRIRQKVIVAFVSQKLLLVTNVLADRTAKSQQIRLRTSRKGRVTLAVRLASERTANVTLP